MPTITRYKIINTPEHDLIHTVPILWDVTTDGGGTGTVDLVEFNEDCIIYGISIVANNLDSAGAATVALNLSGNTIIAATDFDATDIANYGSWKVPLILSEGTPNTGYALFPQKVEAGSIFQLVIGTAALTDGELLFRFMVGKV